MDNSDAKILNSLIYDISKKTFDELAKNNFLYCRRAVIVKTVAIDNSSATIAFPISPNVESSIYYKNRTGTNLKTGQKVYLMYSYSNIDQGWLETNKTFQLTGSGSVGGESYVLPVASATELGGIKVGYGLQIDKNTGVLSVDEIIAKIPIASPNTLGGIKVGSGLEIASDGTLNVIGGGSGGGGIYVNKTPVGTIIMWSNGKIPEGYLECDGSAISRETYKDLYSVIGTKYGNGDGSTTFNLPNIQEKIPIGQKDDIGTVYNLINNNSGEHTHSATSNSTDTLATDEDILSMFNSSVTPPQNTEKLQIETSISNSGIHNHNISKSTNGDSDIKLFSLKFLIKWKKEEDISINNAETLGGHPPEYFATADSVEKLKESYNNLEGRVEVLEQKMVSVEQDIVNINDKLIFSTDEDILSLF